MILIVVIIHILGAFSCYRLWPAVSDYREHRTNCTKYVLENALAIELAGRNWCGVYSPVEFACRIAKDRLGFS